MKRLAALVLVATIALGDVAPAGAVDSVSRWRDEALAVGWKSSQWPWLRCIIRRESRGNPYAFNRHDPHGGSRGLTQANGIWIRPLIRAGIIRSASDLFDPKRNLRAALYVYRRQGRRAWGNAC